MDWQNAQQTAAKMIYEWRKEDTNGELTEPCTLDAIIYDEIEDGAELDNDAIFDALATENKRLERTAQLVGRSLNRTSSTLKIVENGIHISKPMRKNGVTNIAIIYELTDGQTVSVLFHNPDTTPNKLKPDDMMIAWRWLLNRKDITIVVAKEKGRDLPIQQIANRVMALADKNTARFAKANAKKAEETQLIKALEEENAKLEERLEHLNKLAEEKENGTNSENIEEKQEDTEASLKNEDIHLSPLNIPENATTKELYTTVNQWLKQNLQGKSIIASNGAKIFFNRNLSIDHLTHDARRSLLSAQAIEFIADVFETGEYQGRETLRKERTDGIVAFHLYEKWVQLKNGIRLYLRAKAAEFNDGRIEVYGDTVAYTQRIIDMENRERLPSNPTMDNTFGGIAHGLDNDNAVLTILQVIDENGNEIKDEEDEDDSGSLKDETQDAPIELTGNEFGYSENMSIDELREKAIQHLETTMRNDWVDVPALKQVEETTKVQLRKRGFNHIKEHSPNPEKLLILSKIKQLLSTSKYLYSANNVKTNKKPDVEKYHYLSKQFKFKGELFTCVIVIEKDQDGMLHYDILMDKYAQLHLNKAKEKMATHSTQERSLGNEQPSNQPESSGVFDNTAIFDEAQEKYVLNLFIFDENGNEIKDEEEVSGSLKEDNEIDIENLDKDLSAYQQNGEPVFEAAKAYYRDKLQGKMVTAVNGFKVHLLGSTWREMKQGMPTDDIKAKLVPFVPDILKNGQYEGRKDLKKTPTNQSYIAFHSFIKDSIIIDNKEIQARIFVGERNDGIYEFVAYSLHHNNGVMDNTNPASFTQVNARGLAGLGTDKAVANNVQKNAYVVNSIFDDIKDGEDGWNIEIISINGIPFNENGNEIKDDEEFSGSLNDELNNEKERALNNPLDDDLFNDVLRKLKEKNKESEKLSIERNQEIGKQFINDVVGNQFSDFDEEAFETSKESMNNLTKLLNTVENTHYLDSYFYTKDEEQFLDLINKVNQESGLSDLREKTKQLIDEHYRKNKEYGETEEGEKSFQDELAKLTKEAEKLVEIRDKKYLEQLPEYDKYKELKKEIEKLENTSFKAGNAIIDALNKNSSISEEDALEWARNNVIIDKGVIARLNKGVISRLDKDGTTAYPKEKILKDAADFYRLTNGRIGKINIKTKGGHRAYTGGIYSRDVKKIYISGSFDKRALWHEMGHHIEFDDKAGAVAHKFLKEKSVDGKLYQLNKILKNYRYRRDEQAYKGDFISPYIGKYYSGGETEVFSMGLEYLSDTKTATYLLAKDPKMAQAIIGYLSQEKSEVLDFALKHTKLRIDAEKEQEEKKQENAEKELAQIFTAYPIADDIKEYVDKRVKKVYSIRMKKGSRYAILGTFKSNEKNAIFAAVQLNAMKHFGRYGRGYVLMPTDGNRGDAIFYNINDLVDEIKNYYL